MSGIYQLKAGKKGWQRARNALHLDEMNPCDRIECRTRDSYPNDRITE